MGRRVLELSLAAAISGAALFMAYAPAAKPDEQMRINETGASAFPVPRLNPAHQFHPDLYDTPDVSEASRAVARTILNNGANRLAQFQPSQTSPLSAGRFQVSTRAQRQSMDGWEANAMGIEVQFSPQTGESDPNWWIIGGAGRESYGVSPGSLNSFTVTPLSSETVIGDTHLGIAYQLTDGAYASLGYVREKREFNLGREDWEEEDHFIGIGLHARW